MRVYISYFYQIRYFKPWMIPVSTTKWDPKWFHNFSGRDTIFVDKNGVFNGIRSNSLAPGPRCSNLCNGKGNNCVPLNCLFLQEYRKQLNSIDFSKFIKDLESIAGYVKSFLGFDKEPIIVLIVYETPDNLCSERKPIQDWFGSHGYKLEEWNRTICEV